MHKFRKDTFHFYKNLRKKFDILRTLDIVVQGCYNIPIWKLFISATMLHCIRNSGVEVTKMENKTENIYTGRPLIGKIVIASFFIFLAGIFFITRKSEEDLRIVLIAAISFCAAIACVGYQRALYKTARKKCMEYEACIGQMEEALASAEAANKAKSIFLSNMSHDIRTPMNAIIGFAALLMRDAENPAKVREYTRKVTASGQHLLSLINDILDISKIESGKMALNVSEFELADMVAAVDTVIRPQTNARKQTFDVYVSGLQREQLIGDEMRINQVLMNLLSNAVKYTQEGGRIEFRVEGTGQIRENIQHLTITVKDNGYGMTKEYCEKIFDAFTRADNDTTRTVQGTGLGMAITKNIVEMMNGTIEVESEPGKGSTFTIQLDLSVSDERVDAKFWKQYGISRILVVDDEPEVCENIVNLMADMDVRVDYTLNGEEAVSMLQKSAGRHFDYQVILIDWKMPQMDGMETASMIRKIVPKEVPVLVLTGYEWSEIEDQAVHAGVSGFLPKPFFVVNFRERLRQLWENPEDGKKDPAANALAGRHFLVAEDVELNAEILSEILSMQDASCKVVENGQLAVEEFERCEPGRYDAILMDVQMPVLNGYDATKHIRGLSRPDAAQIPIIAMTANAFAEDVKEALDAGMNAHVAKPIDPQQLSMTLSDFLGNIAERSRS